MRIHRPLADAVVGTLQEIFLNKRQADRAIEYVLKSNRKWGSRDRGFIAEKYLPLVDALYGGLTTQFIETVVKFEDGRSGSVSATLNISDAQTFVPVKAAA